MKKIIAFWGLMCAVVVLSSSVFADDDIWKKIEDTYYNVPYALANGKTDSYMGTQRYALEIGGTSEAYDQDVQELRGVSLESKLRDMGDQYAMVSGADGFEVGIIKADGSCDQTLGDEPGLYQINLSDSLKQQLQSSGLNLQNTTAKHVIVNMHSSGILFSDGSLEFYAPLTARFETTDLTHLYSKEELLNEIVSHKEDMLISDLRPDNPEAYNEDGEFNPNTGAC